jgi:hypothetical protein
MMSQSAINGRGGHMDLCPFGINIPDEPLRDDPT